MPIAKTKRPKNAGADKLNNQRRKIIGLLREWDPSKFEEPGEDDEPKAKMVAIYSFVKKHGYLKKSMNAYTQQELPKLVSQMETINNWYSKALVAPAGVE